MKVDVLNTKGEKVKTVELPAEIFEAPIKPDLMHQALVRQWANARLGTHKTKSRGEVSGGGRKPWRQKGTGRARQGSIRAPQWVGGGKVHTPRPRDYSVDMPRKMRRAAVRSALSAKAAESAIVVLDELALSAPKTKEMAAILRRLVGEDSALIVLAGPDERVERSTRNLAEVKTLRAQYLNIRDLLGYNRLVMPLGALEAVCAHLATAGG
ncbi:MAG: 50S ribosomal protein L4 [Chloroflexi bacterium RBG_13_68_17]|nr:MAG: 50S ribosomal protein L4 [Chloroflexi bacterium RBG_13_68_17]